MLYSSYDPGMPSYAMDPDWPKVNWILNNKGTATIIDIQQAIWYFINGGHDPDNQAGLDLVAGANENPNFKPDLCDDGVIAVIVDPITEGTKQQLTIIEVACVE